MAKAEEEGKFMGTVKVGEKGQIVIPKAARDIFNIKPGDNLLLLADKEQGIALIGGDEMRKVTEAIFSGIQNAKGEEGL